MKIRNPFTSGTRVTSRVLREFADAALATPRVLGMRARGGPSGDTFFVRQAGPRPPVVYWAMLNALGPPEPDPAGTDQWRYTFAELAKVEAGHLGWQSLASGRTSDLVGRAYNSAETAHASGPLRGMGVDVTDPAFPVNFSVKPILPMVPVPIFEIQVATGGIEAWIFAPGDFDGTC